MVFRLVFQRVFNVPVKFPAITAEIAPITSDVASIPRQIHSITDYVSTVLPNFPYILRDLGSAGAVFEILMELVAISH